MADVHAGAWHYAQLCASQNQLHEPECVVPADGIPYPRLHHTKVRKRFAPQMDFGHSVPHSRWVVVLGRRATVGMCSQLVQQV